MKATKKVMLIGPPGVGKTSTVRRFVTGYFSPVYQITLGTTIMKKEIDYMDYQVTLSIWDIGGQTVFKAVRSKYYFAASGALAICDSTDYKTQQELFSWVDSFVDVVGKKPIVFIANKIDLQNIEVDEKDMQQLVEYHGNAEYIFTSAKEGTNTEKAFNNLVRMMIIDDEGLDI